MPHARSRMPDVSAGSVRVTAGQQVLLAGIVLTLFVFYLVVELRRNGTPGFPLDDPWIHLTFARNLAQGRGFVFNSGQPVAGSTAPLWTLVMAGCHLFTRSATAVVVTAKLLGAAFLALAAVFALRIGALLASDRRAGLVAGVALASLGPMGWAMMSGMEVTLSVALTLAGVYYYLRIPRGPGWYMAWVLFGASAWARPEAMVLPGFAAVDVLLRRRHGEKAVFWKGVVVWLAALAPYFVLNQVLSGSPFPQTFSAKAGQSNLLAAMGSVSLGQIVTTALRNLSKFVHEYSGFIWRANPVLALLAPIGLIALVVRAVRSRVQPGYIVPLFALGLVPAMAVLVPVFGPAFQSGRYVGNATALLVVATVAGSCIVLARVRGKTLRRGATAVLLALGAFNAVTVTLATAQNTAQAAKSINAMQVKLGLWLRDSTPAAAKLACSDIGAIGYYSGRPVIDLSGLVTKEILAYRRVPNGREQFIRDVRPDYLVIFPVAFPGFRDATFLQPLTYVDPEDNTASLYDLQPRPRALAGVLLLDLEVEPVRAPLVVFKCLWQGADARPD